jgi:hypothetical protein
MQERSFEEQRLRRLSGWSVASLALSTSALLFVCLAFAYHVDNPAGPAEAAGVVLIRGLSFAIAWLCTLAGSATGIVGIHRSESRLGLARASLWLNVVLCIIVIPIVAFSAMFE